MLIDLDADFYKKAIKDGKDEMNCENFAKGNLAWALCLLIHWVEAKERKITFMFWVWIIASKTSNRNMGKDKKEYY